ncbi:hypothetical protein TWF730_008131 [Orbilia blumenaviensis]|uniref:C2H2-type domain-containing protein n=1 Tax=Orbilia blumenaviensis TaxID=1796055 RepID=A0AAV9V9Z5_9PEZI
MAQSFICGACKVRNSADGDSAVHHCCLCDLYFIVPERYSRHNDLYHARNARRLPTAPFTCLDCRKDFYDEEIFNLHLIQHEAARIQYDAIQMQLTHLTNKALAIPSAPFTCLGCSMSFYDEEYFTMHLAHHEAAPIHTDCPIGNIPRVPTTPITCLGCYMDFYDERAFDLHSCQRQANPIQTNSLGGMNVPIALGPASGKHICPTCNRGFAKKKFLREHWRLERQCPRVSKPKPKAKHLCHLCGAKFKKKKSLNKHNRKCGRPKGAVSKKPSQPKLRICKACGKDFATKKLRKVHRCTANERYYCLNLKCPRSFKLVAGLVAHLESATCGSGYDREAINRLICERDTKGLITIPGARKVLEAHTNSSGILTSAVSGAEVIDDDGTSDSSSDEEILDDRTPESSSDDEFGILTPSYSASEASFNTGLNTPWEIDSHFGVPDEDNFMSLDSWNSDFIRSSCTPSMETSTPSIIVSDREISGNICYICRKKFGRRVDLERHVASPVHSPPLYHCGLSFLGVDLPGRERTFTTLSGLIMHLERGACRGGKSTFELGIIVLGKLAEEFGFGAEELAKLLGGKFMAKRQGLLAGPAGGGPVGQKEI